MEPPRIASAWSLLMQRLGYRRWVAQGGELGIDISGNRSKAVDEFVGQEFDYVFTVCDDAKESCPIFPGARKRLHHSFEDPAAAPADRQPAVFQKVRDQITEWLREFAGAPRP